MPAEKISQEGRIIVLESEMTHVKDTLSKLSKDIDLNNRMTLEIKERLDKQNGAIPHLSENVKMLLEEQRTLAQQVSAQGVAQLKNTIFTKILWSIAAVIGTGIAGYIFSVVFGK